MKQYWELKSQVPDSLLFFRMGDFYELFADDAVEAARLLEITLTSRDKNKENPMPMAGVPWHSAQGYIQRLLKMGKKVAIGEQLEDEAQETPSPSTGKKVPKIVRREIVRQFTPGVQFDLEGSEACYLAAVVADGDRWILSCLDASTGECLISDALNSESLLQNLEALPIRHLVRFGERVFAGFENPAVLIETLPSNYLSMDQAQEVLKRHYGVQHLDAYLTSAAATVALGVLVTYALRTQQRETFTNPKH